MIKEEVILPETNKIYITDTKYKAIDRIYGGLHKSDQKLILKDGTRYMGKIEKRSIKLSDGTLGFVHYANKKWFDRCGMPIDKPINLITREQKDE
tara:strand:+ start:382 stop:666 length:285 start_codon:yes stop_codon:yes gene_type:complete